MTADHARCRDTAAEFWRRAQAFLTQAGIERAERILTDTHTG